MKYYRISKKYRDMAKSSNDKYMNIRLYSGDKIMPWTYKCFFIPQALTTQKELDKLLNAGYYRIEITNKVDKILSKIELIEELFEVVEIPKNKPFWFFGFRIVKTGGGDSV